MMMGNVCKFRFSRFMTKAYHSLWIRYSMSPALRVYYSFESFFWNLSPLDESVRGVVGILIQYLVYNSMNFSVGISICRRIARSKPGPIIGWRGIEVGGLFLWVSHTWLPDCLSSTYPAFFSFFIISLPDSRGNLGISGRNEVDSHRSWYWTVWCVPTLGFLA